MTCPHENISLPTTGDPDTVCADCGAVLNSDQIRQNDELSVDSSTE